MQSLLKCCNFALTLCLLYELMSGLEESVALNSPSLFNLFFIFSALDVGMCYVALFMAIIYF